jgi:hypothetical protein
MTEPPASGRAAWRAMEDSCRILMCPSCRESCMRLVNGLHDVVNVRLGKPIQRPGDLRFLGAAVASTVNSGANRMAPRRVLRMSNPYG